MNRFDTVNRHPMTANEPQKGAQALLCFLPCFHGLDGL